MDYFTYKHFCKALSVQTTSRKRFDAEFTGKPRVQSNHLLYWVCKQTLAERGYASSHKATIDFCKLCLPEELSDDFLQEWLMMQAPFPAFCKNEPERLEPELGYADLVRKLEGLTGAKYNRSQQSRNC
jgi:hypothetical protein